MTEAHAAILKKVWKHAFDAGYHIFDSQWAKNPKCNHYFAPVMLRTEGQEMGIVVVNIYNDGGVSMEVFIDRKSIIPALDFPNW